jgi:hypothetical protein
MADGPVEQLLLKFGLDLSSAKAAAGELKGILGQLNTLSDQIDAKSKAAASAQKIIFDQMNASAQAAILAAKQAVAQEQVKQASIKTGTEQLKQQASAQKNAADAAKVGVQAETQKQAILKTAIEDAKRVLQERKAETAEIQKQIVELRKKKLEEGGEGEHKGKQGFFGKIVGAVAGGGIAGQVATGVLAGGGIAVAIEAATEGLVKFIEKLKEFSTESGKLTIIQDVFERLAKGAGIDATESIEKMRESTEGLISRVSLLTNANAGLKKSIPIERIAELQGAVVKLAEGAGKDPVQAVNALTTAFQTGNARMLARIVGIDKAAMSMRGLAPNMGNVARQAAVMDKIFDLILAKSEKMGELPNTIERATAKGKLQVSELFTSFGVGLNKSQGTQIFLDLLDKFTGSFRDLEKTGESWGDKVGKGLVGLSPILEGIAAVFGQLKDTVVEVVKAIVALFKGPTNNGMIDAIEILGKAIIIVSGAAQYLVQILTSGAKLVRAIALTATASAEEKDFRQQASSLKDPTGRKVAGQLADLAQQKRLQEAADLSYQALFSDFGNVNTKIGKQSENFDKSIEELKKKPKDRKPIETTTEVDEPTPQEYGKLAQLRLKAQQEMDKLLLAAKQESIDALKRLDNDSYQDGEETLAKHIDKQKALAKESYEAKLLELSQDLKAKNDTLAYDVEKGLKGGDPVKNAQVRVEKGTNLMASILGGVQAHKAYQTQIYTINRQGRADDRSARTKEIQEEFQQESARISLLLDLNEKQFSQGSKSPGEYFSQQISLIKQKGQAEIDNANLVFGNAEKNDAAKAERQKSLHKAAEEQLKSLSDLQETYIQKTLSAIDKQYQPQQKALETTLGYQQAAGPGQGGQFKQSQEEILASLLENLRSQQSQLEQLASKAKPYSDQWYQIYSQIERTYQMQAKYLDQLDLMKNKMQALVPLAEEVGKGTAQNFHSKFAQNLASQFSSGVEQISAAPKLSNIISGKKHLPTKTPEQQALEEMFSKADHGVGTLVSNFDILTEAVLKAAAVLNSLGTPSSSVGVDSASPALNYPSGNWRPISDIPAETSVDVTAHQDQVPTYQAPTDTYLHNGPGASDATKSTSSLKDFADRLSGSIQAVSQFTSSLLNAKSGISGAIGGATSGAGLGSAIGGAFSGISKMAGPLGAVAGAGIGLVSGLITGQKNAEVTKNINQLNTSFKNLMNDFAINTNNLQSSINSLQGLVQQAQAMQSSSKKGSAQYQQAIDQYNQQLIQFEQQQYQILTQMNEQVAVLQAPTGMADFLNQLEQIVKQYQQFVGAAKNANDLATANQYLTLSLQQYTQTQENQVAQDNQSAIQDA